MITNWVNPKIALGFLIATVFAAIALGWQASYAPTEVEKQACHHAATKAGHKTEECKSLWEKTTSDPVAFFTFVLSISTIALVMSTIALWFATKDAAEAAQAAGARSQKVERGYIVGGGPARLHDEAGKKVPNRGWVSIGNYGKTPAILKKVEWGFCDKTAINLDAPISELFEKKMLPHYEILTRVDVIRHGIPPYAIDGTEFTLADKSGKIFFGKFSYDILFDDKERFSTFKLEITKDGGSVGLPGSYSDWS